MDKTHPLYTGAGDSGFTKDIFLNKIPKSGLLTELFVKLDRLQANIDKAIPLVRGSEEELLLEVLQKKLWQIYPMIQDPEDQLKYITSPIDEKILEPIEDYIKEAERFSSNNFIRFHNDKSIALNDCRVSSRDAEISLHRYLESSENKKQVKKVVPMFFNRLSSLFFAMALKGEVGQEKIEKNTENDIMDESGEKEIEEIEEESEENPGESSDEEVLKEELEELAEEFSEEPLEETAKEISEEELEEPEEIAGEDFFTENKKPGKTILVDAWKTFVLPESGIFEDMYKLLEKYPNTKVIVTNADDEQMQTFGLYNMPYEVFTLKHDPDKINPEYFRTLLDYFNLKPEEVIYFEHDKEAVKSAWSVGITSFWYDSEQKDLTSLKNFIDENL